MTARKRSKPAKKRQPKKSNPVSPKTKPSIHWKELILGAILGAILSTVFGLFFTAYIEKIDQKKLAEKVLTNILQELQWNAAVAQLKGGSTFKLLKDRIIEPEDLKYRLLAYRMQSYNTHTFGIWDSELKNLDIVFGDVGGECYRNISRIYEIMEKAKADSEKIVKIIDSEHDPDARLGLVKALHKIDDRVKDPLAQTIASIYKIIDNIDDSNTGVKNEKSSLSVTNYHFAC